MGVASQLKIYEGGKNLCKLFVSFACFSMGGRGGERFLKRVAELEREAENMF